MPGTFARTVKSHGKTPRIRIRRAASLALVLALAAPSGFADQRITKQSRLELIRGLAHEIAVVKVILPRGKKGLFLSSQGQIDETKINTELREHGAAVRPGTPVQITTIKIESDRILFEINGGGKKGKKWYQRIEIGGPVGTRRIAPDSPTVTYGSSITLTFPGKVPDLTVEQVKAMLVPVLDFNRHSPTVLYTPSVSPEVKEAIKNHQVILGMDRDAVLSSKGPPDRKVREVRNGVEVEDWIYGLPPHVLFVTFENDTVTSVRQH
jgi:hypothetical protein